MRQAALSLWPRTLVGRLIVSMIAALAFAQITLVLILNRQQDNIVGRVVHSQTLPTTAAIARFVAENPGSTEDAIVSAFGSARLCLAIDAQSPLAGPMTEAERHIADLLAIQLGAVRSGKPVVGIDYVDGNEPVCPYPVADPRDAPDVEGIAASADEQAKYYSRNVALNMAAPLPDGRWLSVRFAFELPAFWNPIALMSFAISSFAVIVAVVMTVREQTRSLRMLAVASEKLGRGETAEPLAVVGPSEVKATIGAFNTMQDRLLQYVGDRLRLLASISHDLRTPLTTLRLKAEFVDNDAVRDDLVATIDELTSICEATLAFSRAEATTEETVSVDLAALIGEVVEQFRLMKADAVAAELPSIDYPIRPVAFKRALRNLLDNAVRYGKRATVTLGDMGDEIVIAIEDDGPGIPADLVESAFNPFVRLEASRNSETGGMGLGLSIARSIVKAHGGSIWLTNAETGGLRAEIYLPAKTGS
ncbi:ATP-binding protein [Rhizobiaceae bacterium BDR2-2]|uniref:histidine kinase n=1 Tax=Ectorhizobium quercum TaxID=2965071 RepID=A0AAE3SU71_9HYPH|nr:ATP-binding protein [Ectorhizobium quercum]MCX8996757.1 ATP-binding protein [Ectorhizobium quercum]